MTIYSDIPVLTPEKIKGKIVVVREDYNVPLSGGQIQENTRLVESLPTLQFLLKNKAKRIHLLSHLGRPKGEKKSEFSLRPIAKELTKLLDKSVVFESSLKPGKSLIQLHENVRFWPGETNNDPNFIKQLLQLGGEVFINDAFATSHRAHSSVVGLASFLPAYPGYLLQKEIDQLSPFLSGKKIPHLTLVVGGAKLETKIDILLKFSEIADSILLGGKIIDPFLAVKGKVSAAGQDPYLIDLAKQIITKAKKEKTTLELPTDAICINEKTGENATIKLDKSLSTNLSIRDIGPQTIINYQTIINNSDTVIWNGPMGLFEKTKYANGTKEILKSVAAQKSANTVLGGGDTLEALRLFGLDKGAFSHVSTGGGAMLNFLEGKVLPGINVLRTSRIKEA